MTPRRTSSTTLLRRSLQKNRTHIDLPGLDGLTAAGKLHQALPQCRTLVLTGLSRPGNLLRALTVHVRGFIPKNAPAHTLAAGIRAVARGERVIDPEFVASALETGTTPLISRESDVLRAAIRIARDAGWI